MFGKEWKRTLYILQWCGISNVVFARSCVWKICRLHWNPKNMKWSFSKHLSFSTFNLNICVSYVLVGWIHLSCEDLFLFFHMCWFLPSILHNLLLQVLLLLLPPPNLMSWKVIVLKEIIKKESGCENVKCSGCVSQSSISICLFSRKIRYLI